MTVGGEEGDLNTVVRDGDIAVVHCAAEFTFEPGNRMRAARCLICQELIGGWPATVIGAAALAGDACQCGGIVSDVFLIHAVHLPPSPGNLLAMLPRGLRCPADHKQP